MSAGIRPKGASLITLRVGHVSQDGTTTYDHPDVRVVPHQVPDLLTQLLMDRWPPCRCPQHRQAGAPATS